MSVGEVEVGIEKILVFWDRLYAFRIHGSSGVDRAGTHAWIEFKFLGRFFYEVKLHCSEFLWSNEVLPSSNGGAAIRAIFL